jgi:ribosomal protein S18 acetylase RimI-like enzyme
MVRTIDANFPPGKSQDATLGVNQGVIIRPVDDKDRKQLANLIHFETYVHRHLDWRPPLDWLGHSPYLVAERDEDLLATLVLPPDPPDVAWIRLFAVSSKWKLKEAWEALWSDAKARLLINPLIEIASIPLQDWFRELLIHSSFYHTHNVVLLDWQRGKTIPQRHASTVTIRSMGYDDLPAVHALDALAFDPLWRISIESLEYAYKQSALATVVVGDMGILGYQISTPSPMGGHLARLAVHPDDQSKGIGYALVSDVVDQFIRRGAMRITVNTQQHNLASLALYKKLGFHLTGEVYPVFQYRNPNRTLQG